MRRLLAGLIAALALAACGSVEDAADRCRHHGGIAVITGDLDGGLEHDADAVVECKDGTLIDYQGWDAEEVER